MTGTRSRTQWSVAPIQSPGARQRDAAVIGPCPLHRLQHEGCRRPARCSTAARAHRTQTLVPAPHVACVQPRGRRVPCCTCRGSWLWDGWVPPTWWVGIQDQTEGRRHCETVTMAAPQLLLPCHTATASKREASPSRVVACLPTPYVESETGWTAVLSIARLHSRHFQGTTSSSSPGHRHTTYITEASGRSDGVSPHHE